MGRTTTTTTTVDAMDLGALAQSDEEIDEIYRGAPERFSDPGDESPVIEHQAVGNAANVDDADDMILLVNIYHTEEVVFLPAEGGTRWSGDTVQFINGRLIADRDTANKVLAACPHVYEEPKSGEWHTHDESGFRTRNVTALLKYQQMWADNR